jgi:UDP-2-acetamido-3-amino-2,3-dideoxy-glucuronate N-acetyltransferase
MIVDGGAIHPQACVDKDSCAIGDGTFVWQFASVIRGAKIGQCCKIAANAIVDGAEMGDSCLIGHAASIHPGTVMGDDVFIGPGAIICNDFWPRTSKEGFDAEALEFKPTVKILDGACICAGAIILPGCTIGEDAMVAAGVVCDRSIPPCHIMRRDGSVEPMPADGGIPRRMKWAP